MKNLQVLLSLLVCVLMYPSLALAHSPGSSDNIEDYHAYEPIPFDLRIDDFWSPVSVPSGYTDQNGTRRSNCNGCYPIFRNNLADNNVSSLVRICAYRRNPSELFVVVNNATMTGDDFYKLDPGECGVYVGGHIWIQYPSGISGDPNWSGSWLHLGAQNSR